MKMHPPNETISKQEIAYPLHTNVKAANEYTKISAKKSNIIANITKEANKKTKTNANKSEIAENATSATNKHINQTGKNLEKVTNVENT